MPYLKLKIVSGGEIGQNDNYRFTDLGGSIGRSEDCDWTLLDSDRFVSKKHLVISFRNQQFVLTDVSSNGVIINSAGTPLGRGNEHILRTFDSLVIGKHVVQVEDMSFDIEETNLFQSHHHDGDLLDLVMGESTPIESAPEPKQASPDFFNIPATPELSAEVKPESDLGLEDILSTPIKSQAANEFLNFNDQSTPFNLGASSETSENGAINTDDSLIPDDWEMFDTNSTSGTFTAPIETDSTASPLVTGESLDTDTLGQSSKYQSIPDFMGENTPAILDEEPLQIIQDTPQQHNVPQPMVKSASQEANPQNADNIYEKTPDEGIPSHSDDAFFTALYEKLGLSKEFKASINRDVFADDIATILLSTTQGLMSLLASRTAFKQESRLSSTLIQPRSNNPIKFSIDPVDTLEMLLVKKKKGYMSVGDSYDEAMEDIQLHQMAFMSGLQGTLDGVLAQLAPQNIENQVNKKSQRFMGLNSNSQCWQIYKEQQPLLAKSVKENLNEVLGTYFSEAYQSQINSFKNEK